MTIKQYKKLARAKAKASGTSHQAELDVIARDHGHSSWGPFQVSIRKKEAREACPVRSFVDSLGADEETLVLLEDALQGYLAEKDADIDEYIEGYEFRGDGVEILPDVYQRHFLKGAIHHYLERLNATRKAAEGNKFWRAVGMFLDSHPPIMLPRLATAPIHIRVPLPLESLGRIEDKVDGLDKKGERPVIRPVHVREFPGPSLRPVRAPQETPRPDIRPVEPYSPPTSHLKPVEIARHDLPKIERVETPQEREREMEEDFQRTKVKMDRLLEKMAELRSQHDDDTE